MFFSCVNFYKFLLIINANTVNTPAPHKVTGILSCELIAATLRSKTKIQMFPWGLAVILFEGLTEICLTLQSRAVDHDFVGW
jgi:hypothetical protein